jgi:hypothetical protein
VCYKRSGSRALVRRDSLARLLDPVLRERLPIQGDGHGVERQWKSKVVPTRPKVEAARRDLTICLAVAFV